MCQVWSLDPSTDDKSRALIEKMILEEQYPLYQIVYSYEEYKPYTKGKVILLAEHWFRKNFLFKCWSLKRTKLKCTNPLGKIRGIIFFGRFCTQIMDWSK